MGPKFWARAYIQLALGLVLALQVISSSNGQLSEIQNLIKEVPEAARKDPLVQLTTTKPHQVSKQVDELKPAASSIQISELKTKVDNDNLEPTVTSVQRVWTASSSGSLQELSPEMINKFRGDVPFLAAYALRPRLVGGGTQLVRAANVDDSSHIYEPVISSQLIAPPSAGSGELQPLQTGASSPQSSRLTSSKQLDSPLSKLANFNELNVETSSSSRSEHHHRRKTILKRKDPTTAAGLLKRKSNKGSRRRQVTTLKSGSRSAGKLKGKKSASRLVSRKQKSLRILKKKRSRVGGRQQSSRLLKRKRARRANRQDESSRRRLDLIRFGRLLLEEAEKKAAASASGTKGAPQADGTKGGSNSGAAGKSPFYSSLRPEEGQNDSSAEVGREADELDDRNDLGRKSPDARDRALPNNQTATDVQGDGENNLDEDGEQPDEPKRVGDPDVDEKEGDTVMVEPKFDGVDDDPEFPPDYDEDSKPIDGQKKSVDATLRPTAPESAIDKEDPLDTEGPQFESRRTSPKIDDDQASIPNQRPKIDNDADDDTDGSGNAIGGGLGTTIGDSSGGSSGSGPSRDGDRSSTTDGKSTTDEDDRDSPDPGKETGLSGGGNSKSAGRDYDDDKISSENDKDGMSGVVFADEGKNKAADGGDRPDGRLPTLTDQSIEDSSQQGGRDNADGRKTGGSRGRDDATDESEPDYSDGDRTRDSDGFRNESDKKIGAGGSKESDVDHEEDREADEGNRKSDSSDHEHRKSRREMVNTTESRGSHRSRGDCDHHGHSDDGHYDHGHHHHHDTIKWLEDAIPGKPGEDYPIGSRIKPTSFNCRDQQWPGYYADVESRCQVFHICQADGRQDSFLCPNGTIFSQISFVCVWWNSFDCEDAPKYYSRNSLLYKESASSSNLKPLDGNSMMLNRGSARDQSDGIESLIKAMRGKSAMEKPDTRSEALGPSTGFRGTDENDYDEDDGDLKATGLRKSKEGSSNARPTETNLAGGGTSMDSNSERVSSRPEVLSQDDEATIQRKSPGSLGSSADDYDNVDDDTDYKASMAPASGSNMAPSSRLLSRNARANSVQSSAGMRRIRRASIRQAPTKLRYRRISKNSSKAKLRQSPKTKRRG